MWSLKTAHYQKRQQGPDLPCKKPPAERSWRKNIMRHACPASRRGKTIWRRFYSRFGSRIRKNVIGITNSSYHSHNEKTRAPEPASQVITRKITLGLSVRPRRPSTRGSAACAARRHEIQTAKGPSPLMRNLFL